MRHKSSRQCLSLPDWSGSSGLLCGLLCCALVATGSVRIVQAAAGNELDTARRSLRAAHDAVSAATLEFQTLQNKNSLTRAEIDDYRAYLDRLRQVLDSNCRTVFNLKQELGLSGGVSSEPGCDAHLPAPSAAVAFPDEQTEAEVTAGLDRQLNASLSEFDELLLREMEAIKQRQSGAPDAASAGSGGGSSGGGGGQGDANQGEAADNQGEGSSTAADQPSGQQGGQATDQQGQPGQVAARSPSGTEQQGSSEGGNPDGESRSTPSEPRDQPPGAEDDDIVARQLREAAENEPDPELREKLWEEYRRYKENQATGSTATNSRN